MQLYIVIIILHGYSVIFTIFIYTIIIPYAIKKVYLKIKRAYEKHQAC